jgi:hypothetical protein
MKVVYQFMIKPFTGTLLATFLFTHAFAQLSQKPGTAKSQWVFPDSRGRLVYKTLEKGDRIMDFSYAGYGGGGVTIPSPAVKITLSPSAGDNTDMIQSAIDKVSKLELINGFRGAVLLQPGSYNCDRTININASGVVLRGSGSATIINMTGKPHNCISVKGALSSTAVGRPTIVDDGYVPSGAVSFHVKDASGLAVRDNIRIVRPVTEGWVKFMGMDSLVRDGKKQTWISGEIATDRVIRKIEKNKITVDFPITDNFDSKFLLVPGVSVTKIISSGELSQIGIENFKILCPAQSVSINDGHYRAFSMSGLVDGWARNIEVFNTVNSISVTGRRITVENVNITHELPTLGAAKPADLNGSGQQLLFNNCVIKGDNLFFFGTGAKVTGPIVVLNCVFRGNGWIQPHQRWATGLLVDNCEVPDGGIDFMNRGEMGSGHGWAIGWAVAWNCKAKSFLNQQPPGAANWVIGGIGEKQKKAMPFDSQPLLPEGIFDAYGEAVTPSSLYLAQLSERLGKQALKNIGYGPRSPSETLPKKKAPAAVK